MFDYTYNLVGEIMLKWIHSNLLKTQESFKTCLKHQSDEKIWKELKISMQTEEVFYFFAVMEALGKTISKKESRALLHLVWESEDGLDPTHTELYSEYRIWRAKFRAKIMGNSVNPEINRRYHLHHLECKEKFEPFHAYDHNDLDEIEEFYNDHGICAILNQDTTLLTEASNSLLDESKEKEIYPNLQKMGYIAGDSTGKENIELTKQMYKLLTSPKVEGMINRILGCHFQLRFIEIQILNDEGELYDEVNHPPGLWHLDELPSQMGKVFIYLNDVKEENGAMRCFDRVSTKELIEAGFVSYSSLKRVESQALISKNYETARQTLLEAGAGTVAIFDPAGVIHKAKKPSKGKRVDIKMSFYPSLFRITKENIYQAFNVDRNNPNSKYYNLADYPDDPYYNEICEIVIPKGLNGDLV